MPTKSAVNCFTPFKQDISEYSLPDRFTFPFYYQPHPLAKLAAEELQNYLTTQTDWQHDFGLDSKPDDPIVGKMFGVLVVQNQEGVIGYLSAFSGKLSGTNQLAHFVPPVFDTLIKGDFYLTGLDRLNALTPQIKSLEQQPDFRSAQELLKTASAQAKTSVAEQKRQMKKDKLIRNENRCQAQMELNGAALQQFNEKLNKESIAGKIKLKRLTESWKTKVEYYREQLAAFEKPMQALKKQRKALSASLQKQIFEQYQFSNQQGIYKSLNRIFDEQVPKGGAGECAAPKLLQYAFLNQLKPVTMAEFWWGRSPKAAIRKHQYFYPACQSKCKPILAHMLTGIPTDPNPMLKNPAVGKTIEIIYEDEDLLVIHKPAEFLSVPGIHIKDSVATRMKAKYPNATGPLIVHRLDMSTSGLLLIAKSMEVHHFLQKQFMERTIQKRYIALLDGIVEEDKGIIDLPLRVDLEDRPRQLICHNYGKPARTKWQVISRSDGKTRIHFYPITGRTHQLRVHAAHERGLGMAIVGDDLYGQQRHRLCLHAEWIGFRKPNGKWVEFELAADF